jgi:hypothetical protein
MPPKKQANGNSKTWKQMHTPSARQLRQASGRVYAGETGTRGTTRRGEDPSLEAGKSRAMRPAERELANQDRMARQGSTNDGRSPIRGQGVYGTSQDNRPSAEQLREPTRRQQRRRGDGSLTPPEVGE